MKKTTKTLLVASGILAATSAAAVAAYRTTSKALMNLALGREHPKVMEKNKELLMGSQDLSEVINTVMEKAAELEDKSLERVEITSHDGIKLVGHFRAAKNPQRIVLAFHGWRSTWSQDFGIISDFYYESGCSVLFAEQRAQGGSEGEYMGFGLLERYDAYEWVKWADENNTSGLSGLPLRSFYGRFHSSYDILL